MAVSDLPSSFGDLVREHRRIAGLTQEELAERAGVSPRSISEVERGGAHVPRRDTVALLARALNLAGSERSAFEALVQRPRRARQAPEQRRPSVARNDQSAIHDVPRALTSFVGRELELRELGDILPNAALLTIVGAGGVGKTRLAQELVRTHAAAYADGGWLVDLSGVTDRTLVSSVVAASLGLGNLQSTHVLNTLADFLSRKHLLLVLDNCEHLIDACADLVVHLTRFCPRLHVLVTSREALAIDGEVTRRLSPLDVPELNPSTPPDQIGESAAVRLFVERAQAVNHALEFSEANASALARICRAVDGIPLALELAAARTRVLTLDQLADRLDQDADVLESASRGGLPQHRTMRATIDWSHDLLGEQEQILLRRLSVFACSWTLHVAEQVCSGDGIEPSAVLDLLAQLVDKSMVLVDTHEAVARYRYLEPIRQYALERLEASGEADTYRERHANAFLQMAQECEAVDFGPDEIASLDRLEADHDNLRAALRWALAHNQADALLRASAALFRFWERRGYFQEGCSWLEAALGNAVDDDGTTCHLSFSFCALAGLYWRSGDLVHAQPYAEKGLEVSRATGHLGAEAWALGNLGAIAYFNNQAREAVDWLEQSVSLACKVGYQPLLSLALTYLGRALLSADGPQSPRVAAVLREALQNAREVGSRYASAHALVTLGDLAWRQDRTDRAMTCWRRALQLRAQLADRRGIASCLERLAWSLTARDQLAFAACVFGAAEAQHKQLGIDLRHDERVDHVRQLSQVERRLSSEAFVAGWSAGLVCSVDEAVSRVLEWTR
jgi:non-specific serine/threonine protein kinase